MKECSVSRPLLANVALQDRRRRSWARSFWFIMLSSATRIWCWCEVGGSGFEEVKIVVRGRLLQIDTNLKFVASFPHFFPDNL